MPLDSQMLLAWIDRALSEIHTSDARDLDVALLALEQAKFHILEESRTPRRKAKRNRKSKRGPLDAFVKSDAEIRKAMRGLLPRGKKKK